MNPFQETITSMMDVLGKNMNVQNYFIDSFIAKKILTIEERDTIMVEEVRSARNTEFLRVIMIKPEKEAMSVLLEALNNTAQPRLAEKIEAEYARQTAAAGTEKMHPKFTVKPKDKDVKEGDKAKFRATAKGKPIPEITWFKGDELITSTDRLTITSKEVHGDRTSTLTIHKAEITDSCELRVCAKNTAGEDNCTAKLSASRFASHGSYQAHDSGTTLHLCEVDAHTVQAWEDKVSAIRPAALVWPYGGSTLSVPGVDVLPVSSGWDAMVGGLQDAESRGHKTVAVAPYYDSIKPLSDPITARRDPAATDVWLLWWNTDYLSGWQQELDKDSRYLRIK